MKIPVEIVVALRAAKIALATSEPKMKHYQEPVERHKQALGLVENALKMVEVRRSDDDDPTA
jgi:hypothetical protein